MRSVSTRPRILRAGSEAGEPLAKFQPLAVRGLIRAGLVPRDISPLFFSGHPSQAGADPLEAGKLTPLRRNECGALFYLLVAQLGMESFFECLPAVPGLKELNAYV
jgi:hypothetical protein